MKKSILLLIAGAMLAMTSCHTSGTGSTSVTPTTPTSTFNITINGHSYHLTNSSNIYTSIVGTTLATDIYKAKIMVTDVHSGSFVIGGIKPDLSSALGTYSCDSAIEKTYGLTSIRDDGDGGKIYSSLCPGISTVTVTVSNGTELKGTFSLNLSYNGTVYPITGDFDYKH